MSDRLKLLENMLIESPEDAFLLFALAKEHEKLGDINLALDTYKNLQTINPEYVGLYYHFGKLLEKKEQIEEAVSIFDQGILVAKKQNNQHAWSELAAARTNWVEDIE
jgi:tetratricopeptide (TPR) repeat protein